MDLESKGWWNEKVCIRLGDDGFGDRNGDIHSINSNGYFKWDFLVMSIVIAIDGYSSTRFTNSI